MAANKVGLWTWSLQDKFGSMLGGERRMDV